MIIIFLIVMLIKLGLADKDTIPVFLIDHERVMDYLVVNPNPFSKMTTAYFADIVQHCIQQSDVIIIFVEDSFCAEDVSIKDKTGSPFLNLHTGIKENVVKYFPRVVEPFELLQQVLKPQTINTVYLNSGDKINEIFEGSKNTYKYLYVFFEDGRNETRMQSLRHHDTMIREVMQVIRQKTSGAVIAFYTGKINPVDKIKYVTILLKKKEKPRELSVLVESESALYKFRGIKMDTALRTSIFIQAPTVANEYWTDNKLTTKLAYTDFELEFNFTCGQDSWHLDEVGLIEGGEEVGYTKMGVGAPWNWAYYCAEPLIVSNKRDGSYVAIAEYQIQPFQTYLLKENIKSGRQPFDISRFDDENGEPPGGDPDPPDSPPDDDGGGDSSIGHEPEPEPEPDQTTTTKPKRFGQTINCGPYFNTRILSGLFVSSICFGIMALGIIFLFDCNTNNCYDDPQSKPLVIGVEH